MTSLRLKTNPNYLQIAKEKDQLLNLCKHNLSEYFKSKNFEPEIIAEIVNENFIDSNPSYYLYYPYLFSSYFNVKDGNALKLLSISGYLYYRSTIIIDNIFDSGGQKSFRKFTIANICQEEALKILSHFFDLNSEFWGTWNLRKYEYSKAYQLDKSLKSINDYQEYEDLADFKSAFGKIAIDCLYHLSEKKDKNLYASLLESHKFFYVGFQIMDDILDFKDDALNEQFNIAQFELNRFLTESNREINDYTVENQKKFVYLNGIAENLYYKSLIYLENALHSVKLRRKCLWGSEIECLYNTAVTHLLNVEGFINVYKSKNHSEGLAGNISINQSVQNALNYVLSKQNVKGFWNDVFNDAGISNVWTTSYINYFLSKFDSKVSVQKGNEFLRTKKSSLGLWGYNDKWIEDADSSSFALLNLKDLSSFNAWLEFQNQDGGFSTYYNKNSLLSSLNSPKVHDVGGWVQSHFGVSAVAYLVFIELARTSNISFSKLRCYLIERLTTVNVTLSYWWPSDIYAMFFILSASLQENDFEIISLCEKRVSMIAEEEDIDNVFYKGMMLNTLCLSNRLYEKYKKTINNLVKELKCIQYEDGSWSASYFFKIPHPSVLDANNKDISYVYADKGTNILVKDYNRLFTTITCLTSLKKYGEMQR